MVLARALELTGEVIMPSFTFPGTAHAMRWLGLQPVFCDVDRASHTLDPATVAEAISERTSAILGVHVWGRPCDTDALGEIAGSHGVELIFDAAPAFDCGRHGVKIGNHGRAEVVSFHATKVLNTFEGGAILTNDDELADRIRPMITFGFVDEDDVAGLGINAKMSEAAAAMGLAQVEQLPETIATNRAHHARYRARLEELPGVAVVDYPNAAEANFHYVVLEIDPDEAPIGRDMLKRVLEAENVLARRYFFPGCHRMAPYATENSTAGEVPVTEWLAARVLQLPTGTALATEDVEAICALVCRAFEDTQLLRASLS